MVVGGNRHLPVVGAAVVAGAGAAVVAGAGAAVVAGAGAAVEIHYFLSFQIHNFEVKSPFFLFLISYIEIIVYTIMKQRNTHLSFCWGGIGP